MERFIKLIRRIVRTVFHFHDETSKHLVRHHIQNAKLNRRLQIKKLKQTYFMKHTIPNPNQCPQVNHKDGNKTNNVVSNLEWCSASENGVHAVRLLGLHGENRYNCKLTNAQVLAIRSDARLHREIAADYEIGRTQVTKIKSGKRRSWLP